MTLSVAQWIVLAVAMQRLAELLLARRNNRRLFERGGVEHGRRHYPLFVALHAVWLGVLFTLTPPESAISWPWLVLFVALQAGRIWVIATLGERWTTRIIVVPGAALIRGGPYRYLRHPNYVIVNLEILSLPLAFGMWAIAAIFVPLSLALTFHRIRVEEDALALKRKMAPEAPFVRPTMPR